MTEKLNASYENYNKLNKELEKNTNKLEKAETANANKDTEIDLLKKELEKLTDKYNTLTKTLDKISETANFYNEWKKNN